MDLEGFDVDDWFIRRDYIRFIISSVIVNIGRRLVEMSSYRILEDLHLRSCPDPATSLQSLASPWSCLNRVLLLSFLHRPDAVPAFACAWGRRRFSVISIEKIAILGLVDLDVVLGASPCRALACESSV